MLNYKYYSRVTCVSASIIAIISFGCNKLVQVPQPTNSVTAQVTFSSYVTANAAMLGVYSYMVQLPSFSSVSTTVYTGLSSDELRDELPGAESEDYFLSNTLSPLNVSNGTISTYIWQPAYYDIFSLNSIIAGAQSSSGIVPTQKVELIGEAKFLRAFCYFYLTNLFGDLPLVLTTDFNQTSDLSKSSSSKVYDQILSDLQDAISSLPSDFSISGGQPIRANKWAAVAMLARVALYQGNWKEADSAANAVIGSGQFGLCLDLDSVFLADNRESILQFMTPSAPPYATYEGNTFIPAVGAPTYWLTSELLNAFEQNDLRMVNWVQQASQNGNYYPYKYKINLGQSGEPNAENYVVLRLAEQYLIRAEAEVNLGQFSAARNDIDTIRSRAGLDTISSSLSQNQLLQAVQQEDRIEFFAEWGHRWFDLKRWGIALQVLGVVPYKSAIDPTQLLYPIPFNEVMVDPNLVQNPGYPAD